MNSFALALPPSIGDFYEYSNFSVGIGVFALAASVHDSIERKNNQQFTNQFFIVLSTIFWSTFGEIVCEFLLATRPKKT